jgi:hypothetical protein
MHMTPEQLNDILALAYRRHQHRPSMTASFLAATAADMRHLAADDPERERYRAAAAEWLRHKFDPFARLSTDAGERPQS